MEIKPYIHQFLCNGSHDRAISERTLLATCRCQKKNLIAKCHVHCTVDNNKHCISLHWRRMEYPHNKMGKEMVKVSTSERQQSKLVSAAAKVESDSSL